MTLTVQGPRDVIGHVTWP